MTGSDTSTEFIPGRRITDRSSNVLEGTWTYRFEPEGSGTTRTIENRSRSIWGIPPLRQLLDLVAGATHRPRFQRIKGLLEE